MAAWLKIVTMALRIAQLICAVIIIAIASEYMAGLKDQDAGHLSRFIFTDVVAAISLFLAFIWLIPFSSNHMNWHLDYILVLLSGAAAGWLIYVCSTWNTSALRQRVNSFFADGEYSLPNAIAEKPSCPTLKPLARGWRRVHPFATSGELFMFPPSYQELCGYCLRALGSSGSRSIFAPQSNGVATTT